MKHIKKFDSLESNKPVSERLEASMPTQYSGGGHQRTLKIVDTEINDEFTFNIDDQDNLKFLKWVLTTGREQVNDLYRQWRINNGQH